MEGYTIARREYPTEFPQQLIALVQAGRTPEFLAKDFEPSAQARSLAVQADRHGGRRADTGWQPKSALR